MNHRFGILIPAALRDDIQDTLDSVLHFEPNSFVLVLKDFDEEMKFDPRVTVLPPLPWVRNGFGAVFQKKLWAFDYLLQNTDVDIVLSLDADALLLRHGVFPHVSEIFLDPNIGIAGCCRIAPSGGIRSFEPVAKSISSRGGLRSFGNFRAHRFIGDLLERALQTDYVIGEHALGGAQFFKREMLKRWKSLGWLEDFGVSKLLIPEDGLLGLMTYASGYSIAEIGGPDGLLNIGWKGLPSSPEEICDSAAYATHSVRFFKEMTEMQVRDYFKERRKQNEK